ncbi:MAG: cation:dicarboxylase symporter family transporter [Pseudarcicella sp.]|nr:cation:dicarboxylase symporter family transporter [Pseudarcicella sp.]MBP6409609.1 cation:dicarboxylase symporter family transporter [Pseudarcicella sp.]
MTNASKIMLGMVLGVIVGQILYIYFPDKISLVELDANKNEITKTLTEGSYIGSKYFGVLSKIFLKLIKMIIGPLVFSTLVVGIAKLGDIKSVGRIGIKTLLYFYLATILSLLTGLLVANITKPGYFMNLKLPSKGTDTGIKAEAITIENLIDHIFPKNIIDAMAHGDILQIVVFSIFFGIALGAIGDIGKSLIKALDALAHVMFKIIGYVMSFAPYGVFGALVVVVSKQGLGILQGYLYLIICFFGGLILFLFIVLWAICLFMKIPYLKLLFTIKDAMWLSFSTSSSEASIEQTMQALRKFGCSDRIINFVIPMGYSFNLDGSMLYMTFATVFIAQAYHIELSLGQQVMMLLTLMITSKGIAGVPRASLVIIAGTLASFGLPIEGIALLLGVDAVLDMGRSATSVAGNAVATCVVSKLEGELQDL